MLGLGTSLVKGGKVGRAYVKDGLKLYMPYRGDNTTKGTQFVGTGSTSFDGTNDYIDCGNDSSLALTGAFTISAWFNINSISDGTASVVLSKGDTGSDRAVSFTAFRLDSSGGIKFSLFLSSDGSNWTLNALDTGYGTISTGTWHHIVGTWNGSTTGNIYLDGVLKDTDTVGSFTTRTTSSNVRIGLLSDDGGDFNGSIKNVAIWNRALTATEVQNVMYKTYTEVTGRLASNLVSWWSLESTGTPISFDDSHGSNTGTNSGATANNDLYGGGTPVIPRAIDNAPTVQADAIGAGSALFDADTEYINLGATSNFFGTANARTVSCWVKLNDASASNDYFFYFGNTAGTRTGYGMGIKSTDNDLNFHDSSTDTATTTTRASMLDTWTHICATYDGSTTVKIYVNGVLDTTIATGGALATDQTATAIIGGRNSGDPLTLGQEIDANVCQMGVWQGALTQEKIQSVMEKTFEELTATEKSSLTTFKEDDCADSGLGDWSGDASESFDTDHYDLTVPSNGNHGMDATIVANQLYKITCDVKIKTDYSGNLKYNIYDGSGNAYGNNFKSSVNDSTYTSIMEYVIAPSSGGSGRIGFNIGAAGAISIKNFKAETVTHDLVSYWALDEADGNGVVDKVDETLGSELVTNGTFDSGISGWTDISTGDGSIAWNSSGYMEVIGIGLSHRGKANTSFTTVSGSTYKFVATKTNDTNMDIKVGTSSGGGEITTEAMAPTGTNTYYFTATSTTTHISFWEAGTGTAQIDNVSVKLVNGNAGILI